MLPSFLLPRLQSLYVSPQRPAVFFCVAFPLRPGNFAASFPVGQRAEVSSAGGPANLAIAANDRVWREGNFGRA